MAERYNFKYLPLVGKLPGKSMVEQTETAINELASVVYDNVGHVGNLAEEVQTANTNASNALDKATEALETSGRVYIKQIAAVDVNDYYDSELYYINNDGSTNIPVRDRGFLEVKTNDDKTACEQVFIADSTGTPYYRHGRITEQTLGEETTYVVTWGSWYQGATAEYVQAKLQDYLPLSGGTVTGAIKWSGKNTNAIKRDNGNDGLVIIGGDKDNFSGATLQLFGQTNSSYAGQFYLRASTRSDVYDKSHPSSDLVGYPDGTLTWNSQPLLPVGIVQAFAGTTIPNGWLLCDGSAVSRTGYAKLYAVIGTTYGKGNGSTTFNLPNLVDKFVEGSATAGTQRNAGLPNIKGSITKIMYYSESSATGAFRESNSSKVRQGDGSTQPSTYDYDFDASRSNSIYGKSATVQPPALTMRYIIKY